MSTPQEKGKSLAELLNVAASQQTFENMQKLIAQNEYECPVGSGKIYKRKMLKPRDIVRLNQLQLKQAEMSDPQKISDNSKEQAKICLEGLTDADWEETDASLMEIIVAACLLISKGFRPV